MSIETGEPIATSAAEVSPDVTPPKFQEEAIAEAAQRILGVAESVDDGVLHSEGGWGSVSSTTAEVESSDGDRTTVAKGPNGVALSHNTSGGTSFDVSTMGSGNVYVHGAGGKTKVLTGPRAAAVANAMANRAEGEGSKVIPTSQRQAELDEKAKNNVGRGWGNGAEDTSAGYKRYVESKNGDPFNDGRTPTMSEEEWQDQQRREEASRNDPNPTDPFHPNYKKRS